MGSYAQKCSYIVSIQGATSHDAQSCRLSCGLEDAPFLPFGPSGLATHGNSPTLAVTQHARSLPMASKNYPETPSWLENGILPAAGEEDISLCFHPVDRSPQPGSGEMPSLLFAFPLVLHTQILVPEVFELICQIHIFKENFQNSLCLPLVLSSGRRVAR